MKKSDIKAGMLIIVVCSEYLDGEKGLILEVSRIGDAITVKFDDQIHILYPEEIKEFKEPNR